MSHSVDAGWMCQALCGCDSVLNAAARHGEQAPRVLPGCHHSSSVLHRGKSGQGLWEGAKEDGGKEERATAARAACGCKGGGHGGQRHRARPCTRVGGRRELRHFQDSWGCLFIILLLKIDYLSKSNLTGSLGVLPGLSGGAASSPTDPSFPSKGRGGNILPVLKKVGERRETCGR